MNKIFSKVENSMQKFLKLFFSYHCPPARSVLLVCKALKLNVELKVVNILSKDYITPELLRLNPQHTIPVLQDDDVVISDSHAIAGYLAGKYAKDDQLYPLDPQERAKVDHRLYFDTQVLFPTLSKSLYPLLFWNRRTIPKHMNRKIYKCYWYLEAFLRRDKWLAGKSITIADLCLLPTITTLNYLLPICPYTCPKLCYFVEECSYLPYYEVNQRGIEMLDDELHSRFIQSSRRRLALD